MVIPTAEVLATPIKGTYQGLGRGMLYPVAAYAWNGLAYAILQGNNVPDKESRFLVKLMMKDADDNPRVLLLDDKAFASLISATIISRTSR